MFICIVFIIVYLNVKNENVKYNHIQPYTPSVVHHSSYNLKKNLDTRERMRLNRTNSFSESGESL